MMRRYLCFFSVPSLGIIAVVAILSLFFQPITGDLTRIGSWAERDFGWNAEQPQIAIKANGRSMHNPEVFVLGDSFSRDNYWQSILSAQTGKSFLSFHFREAGCLDDWLQFALDNSTAHTIVMEVVERGFLGAFDTLQSCKRRPPVPFELSATTTSSIRATWPPALSVSHTFMTAVNSVRMLLREDFTVRSKQVVNAPLRSDCASFSNRRADRLLYFADDEDERLWEPAAVKRAIANLQHIQAAVEERGKHFVLLLVPDKLSVYQHCLRPGSDLSERNPINDRLRGAGLHAPDLIHPFRESASTIVDLYRPNDTHLSESGFILMASQVKQFMDGAGL